MATDRETRCALFRKKNQSLSIFLLRCPNPRRKLLTTQRRLLRFRKLEKSLLRTYQLRRNSSQLRSLESSKGQAYQPLPDFSKHYYLGVCIYTCFHSSGESSAPADGEESAGKKNEEKSPVVEGASPDAEAGVGGVKEEGIADTEKAEKLDDGEAEKTEETLEKGEGESEEAKPSDIGETSDPQAGDNETVEAVADDTAGNEKKDTEGGGEKRDAEAGDKKKETDAGDEKKETEAVDEKTDDEDKTDGQEATSTSDQQLSSAKPPLVGVEKKAEEPEKAVALDERKKEEEEQRKEEEEEMVFDYDYEQLKSTPQMVNVTTSDMLTLLYPHIRDSKVQNYMIQLVLDVYNVIIMSQPLMVLRDNENF